jgi:dipeptidyl aminopeptidase/acylaminoacyl peptidase
VSKTCLLMSLVAFWLSGRASNLCAREVRAAVQPPTGSIVVTPDVLLSDASKVGLREQGISEFTWTGDGKSLIAHLEGAPVHSRENDGSQNGDAEQPSHLELIRIHDGSRVPLGHGESPQSSPDGTLIAYWKKGIAGKARTVAMMTADGRAVCEVNERNLDGLPMGTETFAWTRDGRRLLLGTPFETSQSEGTSAAGRSSPSIRDYRGEVDTPISPRADVAVWIWSVDRYCRNAARHVSLPYAHVASVAPAPDGSMLVISVSGHAQGMTHNRTDIVDVDVPTGIWRVIFANVGGEWDNPAVLSPDGKRVAFTYDQEALPYFNREQIAVASLREGAQRVISHDLRRQPQWDPEGAHLWLTQAAPHFLLRHKYVMSLDGQEAEIADLPGSAQLSPDGRHVAWVASDLAGSSDLWVGTVTHARTSWRVRQRKRLIHVDSPLAPYVRGEQRLVEWPSGDGLRVAGLLVLPVNYMAGHRYRLIVDLHGGPVGGLATSDGNTAPGSLLVTSSLEYDMWAAKGYAVLIPDYRESGMYGFEAIDATRKDGSIRERNFDDVMHGVDYAIALGIADPEHMAVIGHSAGAEQVNWIVTHSHRFRAAISYEGGSNADPWISWGVTGAINQVHQVLWGSALEHPERYWRQSVLTAVRGVNTPTLFVSSQDGSYPGNLNAWLYAAWRFQGVDAEHCIYLTDGHTLRQPSHQRDLLLRGISWIDSHME